MRWRRRDRVLVGLGGPDAGPASGSPGAAEGLPAPEIPPARAEHPTERVGPVARPDPDGAPTQVLTRDPGRPGFDPVTPAGAAEGASVPPGAADVAGAVLGSDPTGPAAAAAASAEAQPGSGHHTQVLDPAVAAASADPFRDTTMLVRPSGAPVRPPLAPLLSRVRAAEVGMYCGAGLVLVAVVGIAARLWEQWDGVERLVTTSLAASALILGGLWLRAPWGRRASAECARGVSVMLATGVLAGGIGSALLFGLGQASDPVAGLGHALVAAALMLAANFVARTPYSETALLVALSWLCWVGLAGGSGLWLGLLGLGVAWVALGLRLARGRRTAAVAGTALALGAAAALAAQPDAWLARAGLGIVAGAALWAFFTGRANYWLALGTAAACALAVGTAMDALSPAPALLVGGVAIMAISGIALRSTGSEAPAPRG